MKFTVLFIFLHISVSFTAFSQPASLTESYFYAVFSGNYPKAEKILVTLKNNYPESVKTKLITANYYGIMFEISGKEDKYFFISKKYADEAVKELIQKKKLTNDDVFRIISAKSIILKMETQRKNYLKVARDMQSVIKYFEYALKHENEDDKMKFISGMYNYYIETAKEDYPLIYPVLLFYPSGNKKRGLKLMKECTNSEDNNISVRSLLQLSLIYSRDEKKTELFRFYFEKLLEKYPYNLIYRTEYLTALKKYGLRKEYEALHKNTEAVIKRNTFLTDTQKQYFFKKIDI